MRHPSWERWLLHRGGKYSSQYCASAKRCISCLGIPMLCMIWNWYFALTVFAFILPLVAENLVTSSFLAPLAGTGAGAASTAGSSLYFSNS